MEKENEKEKAQKSRDQNEITISFNFKISMGQASSITVGAAIVNMDERKFQVSEFIDNDQYSNMESFLLQILEDVGECKYDVIVNMPGDINNDKVEEIFNLVELKFSPHSKKEFHTSDLEEQLEYLLSGKYGYFMDDLEKEVAPSALRAAIEKLGLANAESNNHQYTLSSYNLDHYMMLDVAATKSLNIFGAQKSGDSPGTSLYGLFNNCKTVIGSRKLQKWLRQPLQDIEGTSSWAK